MSTETLDEAKRIYGIENWGGGYFGINSKGNVAVRPKRNDPREVDIKELIDVLRAQRRVNLPLLLRFPQLLAHQLDQLCAAFQRAAAEFEYKGQHLPVYPMKVNPRREIVEEFLREGGRFRCGLECGSKAELSAALAQEQPPGSLLVCNGFKDETFINLALSGVQIGKQVVIVIEKINELKIAIRRMQDTGLRPVLGLRAKLNSRGSGKWVSSGGEASKFGLTTPELLECVRLLREANLLESLQLLHYHIGSQLTDIKRVKNALKEASRVYAKLRQLKVGVQYLDIGGGMGVDYDGSKTLFEASMNYTIQEFANNAVYTVKTVCDDEHVPHPILVTEYGRYMTAYHSVLITAIRDEIETFADRQSPVEVKEHDRQVLIELNDLYQSISVKNYREYYHDALAHKDELHTQFNLGLLSLEERAKGEILFWEVCAKALKFSRTARAPEDEFRDLQRILASKYLCNFSVFRSIPDSWAIGQLFPIMPIHRLNETPTDFATLVDVTCDSDGKIDKFVDLKDVKDVLELHPFTNEPYYLGVFLTGAYQDVMGINHNLFGSPNEAHVVIDDEGQYRITKLVTGSRVSEMLVFARYDTEQLKRQFDDLIRQRLASGELAATVGEQMIQEYASNLGTTTYLE